MNVEQGRALFQALGIKLPRQNGTWLMGKCPLAPWLHQSKSDNTPSFGVYLSDTDHPRYNCFACSNGSLSELVGAIQYHNNKSPSGVEYDFKQAWTALDDLQLELTTLPEYSEYKQVQGKVFHEWPHYWSQQFPLVQDEPAAVEYLLTRDMPKTQMLELGLRWDFNRQMVVFPYYNVYGMFAGARGRSILTDVTGWKKHFDYTFQGINNSGLVWYNEQSLNLPGKVVVVEGQFDLAKVQLGWEKVVANLTAKPTPAKMKKLAQSDGVILIPDNDATGVQSVEVYREYCKKLKIPFETLILPGSVKDAGECSPLYLQDALLQFV